MYKMTILSYFFMFVVHTASSLAASRGSSRLDQLAASTVYVETRKLVPEEHEKVVQPVEMPQDPLLDSILVDAGYSLVKIVPLQTASTTEHAVLAKGPIEAWFGLMDSFEIAKIVDDDGIDEYESHYILVYFSRDPGVLNNKEVLDQLVSVRKDHAREGKFILAGLLCPDIIEDEYRHPLLCYIEAMNSSKTENGLEANELFVFHRSCKLMEERFEKYFAELTNDERAELEAHILLDEVSFRWMLLIAKLFAANAHSRISLIASQVAWALEKTKSMTLLILEWTAKNYKLTVKRQQLSAEREQLTAKRQRLTAQEEQLTAEREQLTAERKQRTAKVKKMVAENKALLDKIAQLEGKKS